MECRFEKQTVIPLSLCDSRGRLSVHSVFGIFMDLAAEHAELIGLGADSMAERNMFWLTVRTKIRISKLPKMMTPVTGCTWPESPGRVRCNRYYTLRCAEQICAEGVTEWAIIDTNNGKLCKASDIYIDGTVFSDKKADVEPFEKIPDDFSAADDVGTYRISSSDIDLGRHMNNSAYVRALLGAVSCNELEALNITDAEVVFRHPCYEGDVLSIRRRSFDGGFDMAMLLPDGTAAVVARFKTK